MLIVPAGILVILQALVDINAAGAYNNRSALTAFDNVRKGNLWIKSELVS